MAYDRKRKVSLCLLINQGVDASSQRDAVVPFVTTEVYVNYPRTMHDAGIGSIQSPSFAGCSETIIPEVTLKNFGLQDLTSVTINYKLDNGAVQNYNWSGNLITDGTIQVSLPAIVVSSGTHRFLCYTSGPNNHNDIHSFNDQASSGFSINTGSASHIYK